MFLEDSHAVLDCEMACSGIVLSGQRQPRKVGWRFDGARTRKGVSESLPNGGEHRSGAILVEPPDGVFDCLARDLVEMGVQVVRAESATEALQLCGRYEPSLVLANIDLPDQSGWLLAGKLQFVDRRIRIWLYQARCTRNDEAMAEFLQIDRLLDCGDDLLGLSETIAELVGNPCEGEVAHRDAETRQERTAA